MKKLFIFPAFVLACIGCEKMEQPPDIDHTSTNTPNEIIRSPRNKSNPLKMPTDPNRTKNQGALADIKRVNISNTSQ